MRCSASRRASSSTSSRSTTRTGPPRPVHQTRSGTRTSRSCCTARTRRDREGRRIRRDHHHVARLPSAARTRVPTRDPRRDRPSGCAAGAAGVHPLGRGDRLAARFDRPVVHTPVAVTADAMTLVADADMDAAAGAVVAIGGGSAIGLAKAVSARTGMRQVAVPTTYAGSEVTGVLGETDNGIKTTRRDPALAPGTVVYDAELTVSMPAGLTRTSALNALAHAVEALWAPDASAMTDALAT